MFKRLGRRLRALVGGARLDRQMDQELQFHLDLETNRLVQQGLTPDEARTRTMRQSKPFANRSNVSGPGAMKNVQIQIGQWFRR